MNGQGLIFKGVVVDSIYGINVSGIKVELKQMKDTLVVQKTTDNNGNFEFNNLNRGFYQLEINSASFISKQQFVRLLDNRFDTIFLQLKIREIGEVVIKREAAILLKGDTTQFKADSFKTQDNASAEDLLTKMPGITTENGEVKAQGEKVQRVLVDGKPFFGDDPKAALKTIDAKSIDKIQVYDGKSEKATFSGFDDGETVKTINIITKSNMRSGLYGRVTGGYGTDGRYLGTANLSKITAKSRLSIIGQMNNINQQNFNMQDVLGLMGSSGGAMRGNPNGRNGRPITWPGNPVNDFFVDNQNGISTTAAFGLNYSAIFSPKLSVSASYFLNNMGIENRQATERIIFGGQRTPQNYTENTNGLSSTLTHRLNARIEFSIDSANKFVYVPSFNFQDRFSRSFIDAQTFNAPNLLLNKTNNNNEQLNDGFSFRNTLTYLHRFKKEGNTITLQGTANISPNAGKTNLDALSQFYGNTVISDSLLQLSDLQNTSNTFKGEATYTTLLTKKSQLEINGEHGLTKSSSSKFTNNYNAAQEQYNVLDTGLSNDFNNINYVSQVGLRIRHNQEKLSYSYGIGVMQTVLENNVIFPSFQKNTATFRTLIPNLFVRYKPAKSIQLFAFYRIRPSVPSIAQLQNVLINTNPLSLNIGNPNLIQENRHFVLSRYSNFDVFSGKSIFVFFMAQAANNYIGNSTTVAFEPTQVENIALEKGTTLTKPTNLSGFFMSTGSLTLGRKINKLKSNLNTTLGYNGVRTPSLINGLSNFNNNISGNLNITLSSNISKKIDFNIGLGITQTFVTNNLQSNLNYNFTSPTITSKVFYQFYKNWFAEVDFSYVAYRGLSDGFNPNIYLLNPSLGYRSTKNVWEVKLYVFDALNSNQAVSRNVSETYVEDINSLVLRQYGMIQVLYNIKKIAKKDAPAFEAQDPMERRGR